MFVSEEQRALQYVGTTIDERYEVLSLLGTGGMSVVYKAHDKQLDRVLAVKMLLKGSGASSDSIHRFQQEAKAISRLQHPNIVQIYSVGVSDLGLYLAMDYLEGTDVSEIIKAETRLDYKRALPIFLQAVSALEHAHSRDIIHRDLKPSNIMLVHHPETQQDEFVKLVDFGIAKLVPHEGEQEQQLTRAGAVFGTPAYMSPEQCMGKPLDVRSDIYSFGCVMFEMLCGLPPLEGDSNFATMALQMTEKPPLLSEALPGTAVPVVLENIIDTCLHKDPQKRYQSMSELRHALEAVDLGSTTVLRVSNSSPKLRHHPGRIRKRYLAGALLLLAIMLVGAAFASRDYLTIKYYEFRLEKSASTAERLRFLYEINKLAISSKDLASAQNAFKHAAELLLEESELAKKRQGSQGSFMGKTEWQSYAHRVLSDFSKFAGATDGSEGEVLVPLALELAKQYEAEGRYIEADRVLSLLPSEPTRHEQLTQYLMYRGAASVMKGATGNAKAQFDRCLELVRGEQQAIYAKNAGLTFQNAKQFQMAIPYYRRACALARDLNKPEREVEALIGLAECLKNYGEPGKANLEYQRAVDLCEKNANLQRSLPYAKALDGVAWTYYEMKECQKAAKTFGKELRALEAIRDDGGQTLIAVRGIENAFICLGRWPEAAAAARNAIIRSKRISKIDPEVLNDERRRNDALRSGGGKIASWSDIDKEFIHTDDPSN